jgi:hypothetical protein
MQPNKPPPIQHIEVPPHHNSEQHYQAAVHNRRSESIHNQQPEQPQQHMLFVQSYQPYQHSVVYPQPILKKKNKGKRHIILFIIALLFSLKPIQNAFIRAFPGIPSAVMSLIGTTSLVAMNALINHLVDLQI